MAQHDIKIPKQHFSALKTGKLGFILLRVDRPFAIGDQIKIVESDVQSLQDTGESVAVEITSMIDDRDMAMGMRALRPGYCAFGIKLVQTSKK